VLSLLANPESPAGRLRSRPLNRVYEDLIDTSIGDGNYELARKVLGSLLGKGNIPSKAIYQKIFEKMGLINSRGQYSFAKDGLILRPEGACEADIEKFKFLLFLVDSMFSRNLPCEAPLYATVLSYGVHLGGLPKKISALMVSVAARFASDHDSVANKLIDEEPCRQSSCLTFGWEDLFLSYDKLRNQIEGPSSLPALRVRVSSREVPRVLKAEKNLSYRQRREV